MAIRDQLTKLKDNWLLILLPLVLFFLLAGGLSGLSGLVSDVAFSPGASSGYAQPSIGYDGGYPSQSYAPSGAREATSTSVDATAGQLIAKTASMETKVERGTFLDEEASLKSIVQSSDAQLLQQNVQTYGEGISQYRAGSYRVKVDADKYEELVSKLGEIGEMDSFRETADDVTQAYTDLSVRLANEKTRLSRYNEMYKEATDVSDKLEISDRIFNQENMIKYLEEALRDVGDQVVYSTVDVTLTEEKSGYAELTFVGLSDLVKGFVGSLSTVIYLFVLLLPWALGIWLVVFVVRKLRGKGKKK
ncbi:DUF4349 domain-containing protein [Candidatus Woesearchaeota archaeon]|nr:DUF4349 domain-containing protein [Candidatus Woesearchaeota archaeon]